MGAGIGAQGAAGAYLLAPFAIAGGLALGLVGGAAYGAIASEAWEAPSAVLRSVLEEISLAKTLPEQLVGFSRMHGYEMTYLSGILSSDHRQESRYSAAVKEGIDTVLEIDGLTVSLAPAEFMAKPQRGLILSAHVQLVRIADGVLLDDRMVTVDAEPILALKDWAANHAVRFREEAVQASQRLAEAIVTDYFLAYHFPERVISGFPLQVHLRGLRALNPQEIPGIPAGREIDKDLQAKYPTAGFLGIPVELSFPIPNEFRILAQRVDSLQPTFRWEAFPGMNVTYELKIWRSGRLGPEAVVYSRAKLEQTSYKVETTLEPSTLYYWSVRAHFSENGRERITDWSRRSVKHSLLSKIMGAGILALFPDPVEEGFYVFITPPPPSKGLQPANISSQKWLPWGNWPFSPPDGHLKE
jgi:hypothetical protein